MTNIAQAFGEKLYVTVDGQGTPASKSKKLPYEVLPTFTLLASRGCAMLDLLQPPLFFLVCSCGTLTGVSPMARVVQSCFHSSAVVGSPHAPLPPLLLPFHCDTQCCLPPSLCGTVTNACLGERGGLRRVAARPRPKIPSRLHQGKHHFPWLVSYIWTM